jgi:hypothetical protein
MDLTNGRVSIDLRPKVVVLLLGLCLLDKF